MKKILILIPFYYMWNNYSNIKSNYEYLIKNGYSVDLFSKKEFKGDYNNYELILLMGAGAKITKEEFDSINVPVFSFGFSDPNLFNKDHLLNCDKYFTNDLYTFKYFSREKDIHYYQTTCDKRFHKYLNLPKTTDILVYGQGDHKFVTDRNRTVNLLRHMGFNIKVFGRGWDRNKNTFGFIEGDQLIEEINKAHVLLDLSNTTTAWPHRIFEASACGTPVISLYREDTNLLLKSNREIILYQSFEQLAGQLDYILNHKNCLYTVGQNAQKRCYQDHDVSMRIQKLIEIIEEKV